ncbi:MAG: GDSL-type esterase/lipase family protein, partial [Dorea sp.]|nr:GDSL-type esterase/lipase family protein [Dorea sp.]
SEVEAKARELIPHDYTGVIEEQSRLSESIAENIGSYIYASNDTYRTHDIDLKANVGDVIYIKPMEWTGQTPCRFTLSGYINGGWVNFTTYTTVIGKGYTVTVDRPYEKYRLALVNIDPMTEPAKLRFMVVNLSFEALSSEVVNMKTRLDGNLLAIPTSTTYKQTLQSRVVDITKDIKQGNVIIARVLRWDGVTPNGINIYVRKQGGTTFDYFDSKNAVGDIFQFVAQEDYDAIRFGIRLNSAPTSPVYSEVQIIVMDESYYPYATDKSVLNGKYLSLLGASISTFANMIPTENSAYYPRTTTDAYPVASYHDTYWGKLMDATGMKLLVNNSSAGSYCTTGHGSDSLAGSGTRCVSLHTAEHDPDVIIIQLGGNDFNYSTPIGTYDGTGDFPTTTTTFREAYAVMLKKMQTRYPHAKIYCGTIPPEDRSAPFGVIPEKNESGVPIEVFNNAIRQLASVFQMEVLEFNRCGLNMFNKQRYYQDYAESGYAQHPNRLGHSMMANKCIETLDPTCKVRYGYKVIS